MANKKNQQRKKKQTNEEVNPSVEREEKKIRNISIKNPAEVWKGNQREEKRKRILNPITLLRLRRQQQRRDKTAKTLIMIGEQLKNMGRDVKLTAKWTLADPKGTMKEGVKNIKEIIGDGVDNIKTLTSRDYDKEQKAEKLYIRYNNAISEATESERKSMEVETRYTPLLEAFPSDMVKTAIENAKTRYEKQSKKFQKRAKRYLNIMNMFLSK